MKKFTKTLILILILTTLVLSLTACSNATKDAEAAVTKTFDKLKSLDDEVYEEYFGEGGLESLGLTGDDSQDAFKKFVQAIIENLSYTIVSSEKVDDNNVTVKVDITAIKMDTIIQKLMQDVFSLYSSEEAINFSEEEATKKIFELLVSAVNQPNLETVTTTVDIVVTKTNNTWDFELDDELLNAIYGGMLDAGM